MTASSSPSSTRRYRQVQQHTGRRARGTLNVLLYTTCYNVIDGVTLTIRKIEQELLAAGHFVLLLTTKSGDMTKTHLIGEHPNRQVVFLDNSIPIPFLQDPNNPALEYQLGFSLSRKLKLKLNAFQPSLVHVSVPDCVALDLIQYARQYDIPLMGTYHSNIPQYMVHYPGLSWLKPVLGMFFLHQYCFLQHLLVPTPYVRQHVMDAYHMDQVTSLKIWGRGIDLERFSPHHGSLSFRRSLGIDDDVVVICWVGRMVPEKRTDIFRSVFLKLLRHCPPAQVKIHALIVGLGPSEDDLRGLPHSTFMGWLDGTQLSPAYASCDLFLFPSSVETFGNVTLEAAASGLPLVVQANGSGHLVPNNANGFACHTPDDFYQATLTLVLDKALRTQCALASRQVAMQYEKSVVVKQILYHYECVVDEFYTDYDGHHANRDKVYLNQEGSFVGGSHPWPLTMSLVAILLVTAFRVYTWLWLGFTYVVHRRPTTNTTTTTTTTVSTSRTTTTTTSSPVSSTCKKQPQKVLQHQHSSTTLKLLEEGANSGDGRDSLSRHDNPTVSTEGLSNDDDDASDDNMDSSATGPCVAIGDGPWCYYVADSLVQFIAFSCRLESRVRYALVKLISRSKTTPTLPTRRTRKDSNVLSPVILARERSDGDSTDECSSDDSSLSSKDTLKRRLNRSPMSRQQGNTVLISP